MNAIYIRQVILQSISDNYPPIERALVIVLFQVWRLTFTSERGVTNRHQSSNKLENKI